MGDILFHLTAADVDLVRRATLREPLSPDERSSVALILTLTNLNDILGPKPDEQTGDGYGIEDRNKL